MVEILSKSGIRDCWNFPGKLVKSDTKSVSSSWSIQLGSIGFLGFCWVGLLVSVVFFLSTRLWDCFGVVGLVVWFLGELGLMEFEVFFEEFDVSLVESEVFFEEFDVDLVEFEGFDVGLSFFNWTFLVELEVDFKILVWFLEEDRLGLRSLVWFFEEDKVGLINLVWFF